MKSKKQTCGNFFEKIFKDSDELNYNLYKKFNFKSKKIWETGVPEIKIVQLSR